MFPRRKVWILSDQALLGYQCQRWCVRVCWASLQNVSLFLKAASTATYWEERTVNVWPVVLGWNFTDPDHWDSWVPVIMGIPLGWKTKMFVLLMAWGRYRGQVTEGWGRTFGPGHTDARRRMTAKTWKGHHTVWRSQEDSLILRILQTVDFCPTCNAEYNKILNVNEKQTVKAHIISQRVFHEPFLIFFSKG